MANITPYTNQIRSARYGEEVRGSIVNALEAMNDDITDDTASAQAYATQAAQSAAEADSTAQGMVNTLAQIESDLSAFEDAEQERESAENSRSTAESLRVAAEMSRVNAETGYVAQARTYAQQAAQHASSDNAVLARSWAVGGTGTRYGEDTNNAKYWTEQAASIVTEGGVAAFNGRTGVVMPEAGDYDSAKISRGTGSVESALTAIESAINTANLDISSLNSGKVDKDTALLTLDTTAAQAEADGALYSAITAVGWESEVMENA